MQASDLIKAFRQLNILVIGDVMIDRYLFGQVDRISPEAPVPIVDLERTEDRLGGAANVALNLASMGANPLIMSVIGAGQDAAICRQLFQEAGISDHFLIGDSNRPTTVKNRIWSKHQQLLRFDQESRDYLSEDLESQMMDQILRTLDTRNIKAIVFQDYNKGVCTERIIRKVMIESITRDVPVIVDPKKKSFFTYKRCSLFKPNLKEAIDQVEEWPKDWKESDLIHLGESLRKQLGGSQIMITLSDKGIFYMDDEISGIAPAKVRSVADVCGAGDSVVAVAALGRALNLDLPVIAAIANIAGGQVCERPGVVAIDQKSFQKELNQTEVWKNYTIG
ncbi:MAG: bifunctional ADP-heptose synthase [Bacteroidota bacterium]